VRLFGQLIVCFGVVVSAVNDAAAEAIQFDCSYKRGGDPNGEDFALRFTLDTVTKEAFMVGNAGLSKVVVVDGAYGLTSLEYLPTGAVQTTTITTGGNSVHSRHSMMQDKLLPSQYLGSCRIQ
jgi:hypothetical protein